MISRSAGYNEQLEAVLALELGGTAIGPEMDGLQVRYFLSKQADQLLLEMVSSKFIMVELICDKAEVVAH